MLAIGNRCLDARVYKAFPEMEKATFSNGALGPGFSDGVNHLRDGHPR